MFLSFSILAPQGQFFHCKAKIIFIKHKLHHLLPKAFKWFPFLLRRNLKCPTKAYQIPLNLIHVLFSPVLVLLQWHGSLFVLWIQLTYSCHKSLNVLVPLCQMQFSQIFFWFLLPFQWLLATQFQPSSILPTPGEASTSSLSSAFLTSSCSVFLICLYF